MKRHYWFFSARQTRFQLLSHCTVFSFIALSKSRRWPKDMFGNSVRIRAAINTARIHLGSKPLWRKADIVQVVRSHFCRQSSSKPLEMLTSFTFVSSAKLHGVTALMNRHVRNATIGYTAQIPHVTTNAAFCKCNYIFLPHPDCLGLKTSPLL